MSMRHFITLHQKLFSLLLLIAFSSAYVHTFAASHTTLLTGISSSALPSTTINSQCTTNCYLNTKKTVASSTSNTITASQIKSVLLALLKEPSVILKLKGDKGDKGDPASPSSMSAMNIIQSSNPSSNVNYVYPGSTLLNATSIVSQDLTIKGTANLNALNISGSISAPGTGITFTQSGADAVTRSVSDKLAETVSVKDFGAKCDNFTNDAVSIQKAIDYAESGNGHALFIPGNCFIGGTTLNVTSTGGLYMYGSAANSSNVTSQLVYTGTSCAINIIPASGTYIYDVYLNNFSIQNQGTQNSGATGRR